MKEVYEPTSNGGFWWKLLTENDSVKSELRSLFEVMDGLMVGQSAQGGFHCGFKYPR